MVYGGIILISEKAACVTATINTLRTAGPVSADSRQFACVVILIILDVKLVDAPAGVTQEEGHTGFIIHLPSAVVALILIARRVQPSLSLNGHMSIQT